MAKKITTNSKKSATKKTASTKKTTKKQIEKIEQAMKQVEESDIIELLPEDIKADIVEEKPIEEPKNVDFDAEVKEIITNAEPSEEVAEQVKEFEEEKKKFDKEIEKNPQNTEKIVKEELKKMEAIKKKVEAIHANLQKQNEKAVRRDNFTNLWNGMGYDL